MAAWSRTKKAHDVFSISRAPVVRSDTQHSKGEKDNYALGRTDEGSKSRHLRGTLLQVISVRDMNRRERSAYAHHEKEADA